MTTPGLAKVRPKFYQRLGFSESLYGWLFILPALAGLLIFSLGPVVASLLLSFTRYDIVSPPKYIGVANYTKMFTDPYYLQSLRVTLKYSLLSIPISIIVAYATALLIDQKVRGISIYRTMWYLPSLMPSAATGAVWAWLLNRDFGPINYPLRALGLPAPGWLIDPNWVIPGLVLIQVWGVGRAVFTFLAGLQAVPQHLHEAAEVDGANRWHRFWHITIPMTSSVIFFNLIMDIIGSFQVFNVVYIIFEAGSGTTATSAGPENSALFYVLYLYRHAFRYFQNGYACAMAWALFIVILALTILTFRSQKAWVYYETEGAMR